MPIANKLKDKEENTAGPVWEKKLDKSLRNVLGGSFLSRETAIRFLPFLLFLTLLGLIYISNIYYAESNQRAIERTNEELKELRYEFISEKSKLMYQSKQSEVAKKLEETGITEATTPPAKFIKTNTEDSH